MNRPNAIAIGRLFDAHDCYVLDDKTRVISKRGLVSLLRGSGGDKDGQIERRIAALPKRFHHLAVGTNLEFVFPGGGVAHAVDVDTVVEICSAYAEALGRGELRRNQLHLAANATRVLAAAAKVGLSALVDEATGYDAIRERGELARIFSDELNAWEMVFTPPFVARLCALGFAGQKNVTWSGGAYPRPLAKVFRRIYDLILGDGVASRLKERNPEPRHGSNHHQWLTDEARDVLKRNMGIVTFCAQQSHSRREFLSRLKAYYSGQSSLVFAA
ncbi:MAG: hypothetical protein VYE22_09950 [Myxococcota bacterium]|nr:hypothetical protein [Myxococcota bacterium]